MGPKQIIVRLPNEPGKLSTISELLGENGINIKAMGCGAGELNVVVDDHEKAMLILKGGGYDLDETPVIAAYAPDHPGGLNAVLKPLKIATVNIERIYLSVARKGELSLIILHVDDYEKGVQALKDNYMEVIEGKLVF